MISKLRWNNSWPGLGQPPVQDDEAIVKDYARLVSEVDGVRSVWASYNGRTLTVYTLIDDERSVERNVYQAELALHDRWPEAFIDFRVYRDAESLSYDVQDIVPILVPAR